MLGSDTPVDHASRFAFQTLLFESMADISDSVFTGATPTIIPSWHASGDYKLDLASWTQSFDPQMTVVGRAGRCARRDAAPASSCGRPCRGAARWVAPTATPRTP